MRKEGNQRYKKISMQQEVGSDEEGGGITLEEMLSGDVLVSGATQNIEKSDRNNLARARLQEAIDYIHLAWGEATAETKMIQRIVEATTDGRAMSDIAADIGIDPRRANRHYRQGLQAVAQYILQKRLGLQRQVVFPASCDERQSRRCSC